VWLPPMFLGCRPNNFKRYAIIGGVTSPSSVSDYNASASGGSRREVLAPAFRVLAMARELGHAFAIFAITGCSIYPFRPCKYNWGGRTSSV